MTLTPSGIVALSAIATSAVTLTPTVVFASLHDVLLSKSMVSLYRNETSSTAAAPPDAGFAGSTRMVTCSEHVSSAASAASSSARLRRLW